MTIKVEVEAFARKPNLGGGFRGAALVKVEGKSYRIQTDVLPTQDAAWVSICGQVWLIGRPVSVAHFRTNRFRKTYTI